MPVRVALRTNDRRLSGEAFVDVRRRVRERAYAAGRRCPYAWLLGRTIVGSDVRPSNVAGGLTNGPTLRGDDARTGDR